LARIKVERNRRGPMASSRFSAVIAIAWRRECAQSSPAIRAARESAAG